MMEFFIGCILGGVLFNTVTLVLIHDTLKDILKELRNK